MFNDLGGLSGMRPSHGRRQGVDWNQTDDDLLRKYWETPGYSADQIAAMMKPKRSRNAVIGRARRLNLARKKLPSHGNTSTTRPFNPDLNPQKVRNTKPRVRVGYKRRGTAGTNSRPRRVPPTPLPLFTDDPACYPNATPLLMTHPHHCRAIVSCDDGTSVCCGHPIPNGQNYKFCDYHLSRFTYHPRRYY